MKEKHGQFIPLIREHLSYGEKSDVEYVRGHVTIDEAKRACDNWDADERMPERITGITHRWARWHPASQHSDFTHVLHVSDEKGRGMFAVTELQLKGGAA